MRDAGVCVCVCVYVYVHVYVCVCVSVCLNASSNVCCRGFGPQMPYAGAVLHNTVEGKASSVVAPARVRARPCGFRAFF